MGIKIGKQHAFLDELSLLGEAVGDEADSDAPFPEGRQHGFNAGVQVAEAVGLDGDALFHHPAVIPGETVAVQKLGHCILEVQLARGPSLLGGPPAGQKFLRSQPQILGDLGAVIQRRTKLGHQRLVHIKNHGLNGHGRFLPGRWM